MIESKLNTINYLTESEYEAAKTANNINENELYITPNSDSENVFSVCKLQSSTNQTFTVTGATYTDWIELFKNGDYQFDSSKNGIKITKTNYVEIKAAAQGSGNAFIFVRTYDYDTDEEIDFQTHLIQPSENTYWSSSVCNCIVKLNPNKSYYIKMHMAGYNNVEFQLNKSLNVKGTWLSARKIA